MNRNLKQIADAIYNKCAFKISDFKLEQESQEYDACQFKLNQRFIISRSSKITPKKVGQFVTFWKRDESGPIQPFHESDAFDFFIVNVWKDDKFGQFVFPKSILINKGIISTNYKEGKRAFRVYPSWDKPQNKQAERIQIWQLNYFYEIGANTDLKKVSDLYQMNTP